MTRNFIYHLFTAIGAICIAIIIAAVLGLAAYLAAGR